MAPELCGSVISVRPGRSAGGDRGGIRHGAWRSDPFELRAADNAGRDGGAGRRAGDYGEVQFAFLQTALDQFADAHEWLDEQVGVGLLDDFDQLGHPGQRRQFARAKPAAARVAEVVAGLLHELVGVSQQILGVRHKLFAQRCQRRAARAAAEELSADR